MRTRSCLYLNRGLSSGELADVDHLVELLEEKAEEPYANETRLRFALRGLDRQRSGLGWESLCRNAHSS